MKMKIADLEVGDDNPCFIIAEAGVNHNGDVNLGKKLIDIAKDSGADAVKFQTWITEEIVTKQAAQAEYQTENTGKKESQFDMIKRLELGFEDFKELKKYSDEKGIIFFSTPDDEKSVEFLFELRVPAFKIGSGELTNHLMLERIAKKKLPVILSTGMATLDEVKEAVETIVGCGNNQLVLLHCTSDYPAALDNVNLRAMKTLSDEFSLVTGYSDHTEGIKVPVMAALLGAKVIEKHYTFDKNADGPDHKASLAPDELKKMVSEIRRIDGMDKEERKQELKEILDAEIILGSAEKKSAGTETEISKLVRKSIVAYIDIKKGDVIKKEMLAMKRPGTGLSSREIINIIGKTPKKDIQEDTLIELDMVE